MIKIQRIKYNVNGEIIEPEPSWIMEAMMQTDVIKDLFASGLQNINFLETLYKDIRVTKSLEYIFNSKCCYCERPLCDLDWDVEHYRPKKKPIECETPYPPHYGYYWLVYKWENLYISCPNCNRTREDKDGYDFISNGRTGGKLNSFPLSNPLARSYSPACSLATEDPLLIDPCNDRPEDLIKFDINGNPSAKSGSLKAQKTIEILNLGRSRLNRERASKIKKAISTLKKGFDFRIIGNYAAEAAQIQFYIDMTSEQEPFSAAVKNVVHDPAAFDLRNEEIQEPDYFNEIRLRI